MLNGAQSFQKEILDGAQHYQPVLPSVTNDDIIMLEDAGHGLHFEQPLKVRKLLHGFLLADHQKETKTQRTEEDLLETSSRLQLAAQCP